MTKRLPNPTHPSGDAHWTRRTPERIPRGAAAPGAKLNEAQIDELCDLWRAGTHNKTWLGRRFGVTRITVWRHLRARGLIEAV